MSNSESTFTLKTRSDLGATPKLNYWGAETEYGVLRNVLLGPVENYKWLKTSSVSKKSLRRKEKYDLNNIHYLGELHNEKVLEIISNSSAVITATKLYEGQPTLLCEASMLGVPSIYPVSGGIHEFFPSDSKLSYQQSNLEDLTNKLDLILDNELLEIEGVRNKEFISKYLSEESLINEFEKILENEK